MEELYGKFFSTMHKFQRLRIGDLFPDLTNGECMTLMAIERFNDAKETGVLTVSELAENVHSKSSAVSRTLKLLEDKGYIVRSVNKSDRRNTYVEMTESGKAKNREIEDTMRDFARAVLKRIDEEDMKRLIAYLDKLYQVSRDEMEFRKKQVRENE